MDFGLYFQLTLKICSCNVFEGLGHCSDCSPLCCPLDLPRQVMGTTQPKQVANRTKQSALSRG